MCHHPFPRGLVDYPRKQLRLVHAPSAPQRRKAGRTAVYRLGAAGGTMPAKTVSKSKTNVALVKSNAL